MLNVAMISQETALIRLLIPHYHHTVIIDKFF